MTTRLLSRGLGALSPVVVAAVFAFSLVGTSAQQGQAIPIDSDDIGGTVTGVRGPEAGVWVIAEARGLQTGFRRIVVTDDQGRYVVPDLPQASYDIWVRGYGLIDSSKVQSGRGQIVNLTAVAASDARAAAQYYPAGYWWSLLQVPAKSEFPGTGPSGNGISPTLKSQAEFLRLVKTDSCWSCHQLGNKATREIPAALGAFDSSAAAWERRVQSGQAGANMIGSINNLGRPRTLAMFADWTDRVAKGELPPQPPRPQGIERNVVITQWDWADPRAYLHDGISSDKRDPTVNANGPIYGALEASADYLPVVDPVRNTSGQVKVTVLDPANTPRSGEPLQSSPYWGEESIWNSQGNVHSLAMDRQSRVWVAARVRPPTTPEFCRPGSTHPSAMAFPLEQSGRQLGMYDPKTKEYTPIDTCFGTHHLNFAEDADNTLWFCGGGQVVGWFNTRVYDETKDLAKAQGWTALVLDTNGNGRRDAYVEPDQPVDAAKDKRINAPFYGVSTTPDGAVWGSVTGSPGGVVRLSPGLNPPSTALAEYFEVPWSVSNAPARDGFGPRGFDVDRNGVAWLALASGHLASFDRRKCQAPLNGPSATGKHCAEGWTLYPLPGPQLKGVAESGSAEAAYYAWVDQFDTFGAGRNVPFATANAMEAMVAVIDGQVRTFRIPYPLGFYGKGADGRIDDPKAGWKGKGMYTTYATRAPFHSEGGRGTTSKVVKLQLRPNPLAR
jgi:hypothetical protein